MALSLLKRSDADVVLAATTDDPEGLAECLSAQQPFRVDVFATFPGIGWALPSLQRGLKTIHIANGWFAAAPLEVAKALCDISNAQKSEPTSDQERCHSETEVDREDRSSVSSEDSFDPAWHQFLQPCPREDADKATVLRKALKARLGAWQATALLSNYREATLRLPGKGCQRFIVDCRGEAMRFTIEGSGCQAILAA
jgi:hypothetical protein